MGNSHAKAHHGDTFDGGRFEPFGIYPDKDQDFDRRAVRRLILDRKIAPFYKGAEDTEDGSAEDTSGAPSSDLAADTSAAHMQPQASHESLHTATGATAPSVAPTPQRSRSDSTNCTVASAHPAPSTSCVNGRLRTGRPTAISPLAAVTTSATTPPRRSRTASACPYELTPDQERELLLRAVECPICFLYYPRHINYSRCCHHAICTECFVQIKRHEPILAPTTCPFCTQPDFGVTYAPPVAFCDRGSRSFSQTTQPASLRPPPAELGIGGPSTAPGRPQRGRSQSLSLNHPDVVSSDDVRPGTLRIIQARERTSHRPSILPARRLLSRQENPRRPRSTRPREAATLPTSNVSSHYNGYLQAMHHMGADLEELMIMEAIRISMIEHQDRQGQRLETTDRSGEGEGGGGGSSSSTSNLPGQVETDAPSVESTNLTNQSVGAISRATTPAPASIRSTYPSAATSTASLVATPRVLPATIRNLDLSDDDLPRSQDPSPDYASHRQDRLLPADMPAPSLTRHRSAASLAAGVVMGTASYTPSVSSVGGLSSHYLSASAAASREQIYDAVSPPPYVDDGHHRRTSGQATVQAAGVAVSGGTPLPTVVEATTSPQLSTEAGPSRP